MFLLIALRIQFFEDKRCKKLLIFHEFIFHLIHIFFYAPFGSIYLAAERDGSEFVCSYFNALDVNFVTFKVNALQVACILQNAHPFAGIPIARI